MKNGGTSNIIPAYITKEGEVAPKKSSCVTKEQFKMLQKYIIKTIKNISKEILSGKIDIKPYYKTKSTPCGFCEYKTICQFDKNKFCNSYNYIPTLSKEEALEKIEKEEC